MAVPVWRRGMNSGDPQYIDNASIAVEDKCACLTFFGERGFGESEYTLRIASEHFRDLIEAMLRANADEAIKAIGSALKDGIPDSMPEIAHPVILSRRHPTPEER